MRILCNLSSTCSPCAAKSHLQHPHIPYSNFSQTMQLILISTSIRWSYHGSRATKATSNTKIHMTQAQDKDTRCVEFVHFTTRAHLTPIVRRPSLYQSYHNKYRTFDTFSSFCYRGICIRYIKL